MRSASRIPLAAARVVGCGIVSVVTGRARDKSTVIMILANRVCGAGAILINGNAGGLRRSPDKGHGAALGASEAELDDFVSKGRSREHEDCRGREREFEGSFHTRKSRSNRDADACARGDARDPAKRGGEETKINRGATGD